MKRRIIQILSVVIAMIASLSIITVTSLAAENISPPTTTKSRYESIDISSITQEGNNPVELSSAASASAAERLWYEYVTYSPQPVASYRLDDERRLLFYDPYDYTNSMVMEVVGQESDWSSADSIEVSFSYGSSAEMMTGESSDVSTSREIQEGMDESFGYSEGVSSTSSTSWSSSFETSQSAETQTTLSTSVSAGTTAGVEEFGIKAEVSAEATTGTEVSSSVNNGYSTSSSNSGSVDFNNSSSTNVGWSILADRVTTATGSSVSTSRSWSTEESTTVTRTFNAAYFNEGGAPLQWKIVQYRVQMPMKFDLQCLINGEWVTTDSDYCVLTTIQGSCRAWMQNTQAYIEHWGTGEPVTWDEFWSSFFTKEKLIAAYQNKLYPSN